MREDIDRVTISSQQAEGRSIVIEYISVQMEARSNLQSVDALTIQ